MSFQNLEANNCIENDNDNYFAQQNENNILNDQFSLFKGQEVTPGNDINENEIIINNHLKESVNDILRRPSVDNYLILNHNEEDAANNIQNPNYQEYNNEIEFCAAPPIINRNMNIENSGINETPKDPMQRLKEYFKENNEDCSNTPGLNLNDYSFFGGSGSFVLDKNIGGINNIDDSFDINNDDNENKNDNFNVSGNLKNSRKYYPEGVENEYKQNINLISSSNLQIPFIISPNYINTSYINISGLPPLIDNSQNLDIKDAPVNKLLNSSSSHETNLSQNFSNSNSNFPLSGEFIMRTNFGQQKDNINNNNMNLITTQANNYFTTTKNDSQTKRETNDLISSSKVKKKNNLRRLKSDSIRKRIKARTHKNLIKIINKKLASAGSNMFFDLFPQPFTADVNILRNKSIFKLSLKNIFKMYFGTKTKDREKVKTNVQVINYLENNYYFHRKDLKFLLDSSYEDILKRYLKSVNFEKDIEKLNEEGESQEYINKYKYFGEHWFEFYNNKGNFL